MLCDKLRMKRIHIVDEQADNAARNTITGKGGHMQPHPIARQPHETGVRLRVVHAVCEAAAEAEAIAIEVFRPG